VRGVGASDDSAGKGSGRVDAVDCARGLALMGMMIYHLVWDLAGFHLAPDYLPFTPPMRLASHSIASLFLALVGVSLALAHRNGLNERPFWRRLAIVAAAAGLVTATSLVLFRGEAIFFGILHCIAVASLVAGPFVAAPAWASLAVGLAALAAPFFVHSTLFDPPWLLWLGLGETLPNTRDWYPLLPWAGVVFLGLGVARLPGILARLTSPKRWRAAAAPWRAVCFAGRQSLPIYLLHQPIFFGLFYALTAWGGLAPKVDYRAFLADCHRVCVARGQTAAECDDACRCVADAIERSGEADRLATLDAASRAHLQTLADACMGR
jgi:uncharacterized membrane protein